MERLILFLCILLVACNRESKNQEAQSDVYYTCSMHPQVMEDHPGKCPICHMELISASKQQAASSDEIKLSDEQIRLGNIQTDTLKTDSIGETTVLTATLNVNADKTTSVSLRAMGRIETLYFKTIGDYVHKGDKLYDLYSENLNIAKQEYLLATQKKNLKGNSFVNPEQLMAIARNKLLLYGLTEEQLKDISATPLTTIYSRVSGYITEVDAKEGDNLMQGSTVLKLADLTSLWAEAQVYPSQLKDIHEGLQAEISFPDFPEKSFQGKIDFINPELNSGTQLNLVRIEISNSDLLLQPGMPVQVSITHRQHSAFTMPIDAVLRDSRGASVWVRMQDNSFKNKMVGTGIETGDKIEITSGLEEGEVVVTSGAYLLKSEYVFKKGAKPMEGMKM